MQKIVQRRLAAETNVKRRVGRMKLRKDSDNKWQDTMSMKNRNAHLRFTVQNERKNRREDWERGPRLAPKRDVGVLADKYGTVDQSVLFITKPKPSERWEGGTWVAEGDRVVFLKGQDKGKIGEVAAVDVEKQTVHLKEHAKAEVRFPDWLAEEQGTSQKIISQSYPVSWKSIKLVYALPAEDGTFKDVIVDKINLVEPTHREKRFDPDAKAKRFIAGMETEVPWPEVADVEEEDHDADTLRISVDDVTHHPYLLQPPMPTSVIDELRNKYSKFRSRHEPEYVEKKEREVELLARRQALLERRYSTPTMELKAKRVAERAVRQELNEEQLASIGEAIARSRGVSVPQGEATKDAAA